MATIVTRSGKGSPLTNNEVDANFINLNTELGTKVNASSLAAVATSGAYADLSGRPTNVSSFANDSGYLTSFTEADPTVPSHVKSITTTNISNWDAAFSWGNHASVGYLTSFTEADPTVPSHVKAITTTNISNWNTAFGWGNHASAGYLTGITSGQITTALGYTPAASGANSDITSMTGITGGISSPDFVQFDTTATVTPATGRLYFNDGEGGLSYTLKGGNVVQEVGQSQQVLVYNGTGAALSKGQVVYSNGAQGQRPTVALALATGDATSARTLGIVAEAIANGAEGWVTSLGIIENINTSAFTAGAQLYLSGTTAGGLTATKPVAPIHMVYVARCIKSHATAGRLFVTVQNGYELDELHDVAAVSPSNGQTIVFNSTTGLWEKNTVSLTDGVNGTLPATKGGTGITAVGAAGNVLTSDGTAWVSSLPASGGLTYTTVKTANFTALVNTGVQTDTSGGAFTVTLPASPAAGAQVVVVDSANSWATNNLIVGRNGSTIEGDANNLICDISGVSVQFIYNGTTWDVFAQAGGAGGGTAETLPVSGGGTGATSLAANAVVLGNGTSAVQTVAPSTSGNVLTSNGTTWVSSAAPSGAVAYPQNIQSGNYTLVLSDAGKQIYSTNSAPQTITIPTNASVAFPIGTIITFFNMGSGTITLSNTGVSIFPIGSLTSLSNPRIASGVPMQIVKTATNAWNILVGTTITSATASYLIVGGGGSGGSNNTNMGTGGGGAGGLLSGTSTLAIGTTYTITVGAGGATQSGNGNGNSGSASSALSITASGGGGGSGVSNGAGVAGASGGGGSGSFAAGTTAGGSGTSGQGNAGGTGQNSTSDANAQCGGGGGGASTSGVNAGLAGGNGGAGAANSITGSSVTYAGGGGGGKRTAGTAGTGGTGGGGNGGADANGSAGTANRGGGGGGAGTGDSGTFRTGGAGGSGVVILSIPTIDYSGITTGSPTVTTSGSNTILQFNSSGSYTA
jgi:hypothetical protein